MSIKQEKPYYCGPASLCVAQQELGHTPLLSQDEWASIAKTTSKGTSIAGLKRAIRLMASGFEIVRKAEKPWYGPAIFYDHRRDHWMFAKVAGVRVIVHDSEFHDNETDKLQFYRWDEFQEQYMNSKTNSYALVIKP